MTITQHVQLSSERLQSGRLTAPERQALERGRQLKDAVDMLVHQPEQFENVGYTRSAWGVRMETHNGEGQKVEFSYTTQPSKSRGFRRLVAASARSASNAAVAVGGGLVRLIPGESGKMLMGLALATPVGALDASAQRLEHDPEEVDQVYHRQIEDPALGRVLVSETVLLHPDGSYEYIAR